MPSKIFTNKVLLESRWLAISNLPEIATEKTVKECFERYGRIQSVRIIDQHFAFIAFFDIRTASKAHHAENILHEQQLRTAFHDGSNIIPKILLETSPVTSSIIEPFSSSPSSITTVTNTLMDKTITAIHKDTGYSPEENTRHQVVPMKHDSGSSENKRKTSSLNTSKTTIIKSSRRKYENSSSSSESKRSHDDSLSHKYRSKLKRQSTNLNHLKTNILKIYHLPSKMSTQSLREILRNIFNDFKKSSHLLSIKIIDDYALLTFEKSEDVDKALLFIRTKSINGIRLKAEPYDDLIIENDEYDLMKRSDLDIDEYSVKATRTLYIGNLQSDISYNELREIYSVYGDIIEVEIKRQQSQHPQTFAFIQYADIKSVVKAMKALESKVTRDHSIKLGFGKSQPTNVLWLDDLPLNITELNLRSFLIRITNLSSDQILDIYIDNKNDHHIQISQCLIYFIDINTAQNVIHLIRGKKFQKKRIQIDFASKVFITRFSDIIQQINYKKNNDRWTNRSERRYSKVSDTENVISSSRNQTYHHSSSSSNHSSINHKKINKSDKDTHANTERIFDWLMQNHHSNVNDDEEEEEITNLKLIKNKKEFNEISRDHLSKKIFQTKIISLESDSSFIQTDIRLKFYSSLYNQSINSLHLPLPQFAKNLIKSSNIPIIINPKAHLKHLSFELNDSSIKQELININRNNDDLLIQNEIDERIKLLDKQMYEINQNNLLLSSTILFDKQNQKISTTQKTTETSSNPSLTMHTTLAAAKYNPISSTTITSHLPTSASLISPPSSANRLNPSISNDKSTINLPSPLSDTNNNSFNTIPTKLLERLGPSAKFKRKSIPPPLSAITTLPMSSNNNDSPIFPTSESITPSSIIGNQNHSPVTTCSPISQQQIVNNSPKSINLKSILKRSSSLSQSLSNETRKEVHIISTNPSFESTVKRTLSLDAKKKPLIITNNIKKHQTETKKLSNPSITSVINNKKIPKSHTKPIETTVKSSKIIKKPSISSLGTKVVQSTIKHLDSKPLNKKSNKIQKPNIIQNHNEPNKKSSSSIPIQQKKTILLNNQILKRKQQHQNNQINKKSLTTIKQHSLNQSSKINIKKSEQKLIIKSNHNNKIPHEISKNKFKLKQNTCMYDRIKQRTRNEQIQKHLSSTKDDHSSDDNTQSTNILRLKRHNKIIHSSESDDDISMKIKNKKTVVFDRNIFDTEENNDNNNKINQQQMIISKTNFLSQKRPSTNESIRSSKKIKLQSKLFPSTNKEQTIKYKISSSEKSSNNTFIKNSISNKVDTNHHDTTVSSSKNDDHQYIPVNSKEESTPSKPILENDETIQLTNSVDSNRHEQIKSSTNKSQQDSFNKQQIPNEKEQNSSQLSSQILTDKSTLQSIENPSNKESIKVSQHQISQSSSSTTSLHEITEETINLANKSSITNSNPSNLPINHQAIITNKSTISIPTPLPDIPKSSCFPTSTTNETLNLFDSRSITSHKHPSTSMHLFPQILTPDNNLFTPHHQHFSYPIFAPPDSPPLSTRTLSTSSCGSIIGNSFYNTIMSGQQHCHDKESRRDSITKSSSNHSTPNSIINQQQYLGSDTFRNPSELYNYPTKTHQILNSFATEFYRMNDIQSYDPYNIQWEGYIILKSDQAYIKTQLIAGNPQIARISINYWNSNLNHYLRISQRMRLEEIQLVGVEKRMQIDNDHCILIAEPNGLTPDEIHLEQNHLKNGVIQYLNEKKAAGIINILLPGVLQPIYVVHIFPPCQFASEILQKRAPDAYRCVVQNKIEQIYLLFIITSTVQ